MTDKEIIIDGVDITECDHFSMGLPAFNDPCTLYPHLTRCSENKNCYYKQLARKTQECEELKETLNKLSQGVILPMPKPEVINLTDCYKQALEKIEEIIDNGTLDTQLNNAKRIHSHYLARFCDIRDIINEVKDGDI